MPIISRKKREKILKLEKFARLLYKQGFSTREVGKQIGKSHQWVWNAINKDPKKLLTVKGIDK